MSVQFSPLVGKEMPRTSCKRQPDRQVQSRNSEPGSTFY